MNTERIDDVQLFFCHQCFCPNILRGMADRISISPSETRICQGFQKGVGMNQYPGRTIHIADFDVATRTVSHPVAISDPAPNPKTMMLFPCWTSDESAISRSRLGCPATRRRQGVSRRYRGSSGNVGHRHSAHAFNERQ